MKSIKGQISEWNDPDHKFKSQYGVVTYYEWCVAEVLRINASGGEAYIEGSRVGDICLCRHDYPPRLAVA